MVMLLRDFGPYAIIFYEYMCVITVAMVMLLRDSGPYGIIFYEYVCYNRCHGNAVKGFWALWDNIYDYVCLLL
jgi:hypothetical protein